MYRKILVPVDVSHPESGKIELGAAAKIVDGEKAEITLLSVIADVPNLVAAQLPSGYVEKAVESANKQLGAIAENCGLKAGSYRTAVRDGVAHHEILEEAKQMGAELIIVASHLPGLTDYLLGSTAARVVRHAGCSVLVVRS